MAVVRVCIIYLLINNVVTRRAGCPACFRCFPSHYLGTAYARAGYVTGSLADEPLTPISTATNTATPAAPAPRPLATGAHELEWADRKIGRPAVPATG